MKKIIQPTYPIKSIYFLAAIFITFFLSLSSFFTYNTSALSKKETAKYIRQTTQQIKIEIEQHIENNFRTLMNTAALIQNKNLAHNIDTLNKIAETLTDHNSYIHIGFAGLDGQAVWIDKQGGIFNGSLIKEPFLSRTLAGENSLSKIRLNKNNRTYVNYYSVPIYDHKGLITGILFAASPEEAFKRIISLSIYNDKGYAHIIDSQGNYILQSDSPLVIGIGDNIFDTPTQTKSQIKARMLKDLGSNRDGYIESVISDQNNLVSYAPLNINAWHVFYVVPERLVNAELKNLTAGAFTLLILAVITFSAFIYIIYHLNSKQNAQLQSLAFYNQLTGLPNMQKFIEESEKILKNHNGEKYAFTYADIKGFQYINSLFGRAIGDNLLRYWSKALLGTMQKGEVCAHVGADVFVCMRKYTSKHDLQTRFESLIRLIAVHPETFSRGYKPEIYCGAYFIDPADGELSIPDMLDRAHAAQKTAKNSHEGKHFAFYTNKMREEKLREAHIESRMAAALENHEFKIYLQPKIDIQKENQIVGAEALIRWQTPEGLILPDQFIKIFEKNGFIVKLDRYVFETVCQYYSQNLFSRQTKCILAVNVSRLALWHPDFIKTYTEIKNNYAIPDHSLELEFTESLSFENQTQFQAIVALCRRHGFLCSLDDFGSGYSSLNILKSIHVDILKLDRLFFHYGADAKRGRALVQNIINMAKALDMKTIAEGIDSLEQVKELREMGCDAVQGHAISPPIPAEDFKTFLDNWPQQHE